MVFAPNIATQRASVVPLPRLAPAIHAAKLVLLIVLLATCAHHPPRPLSSIPRHIAAAADTVTSEQLAPGITLHHLVRIAGPQRAHVLDIDLDACVSVQAVKGGTSAVGRQTTSALLRSIPDSLHAIAAVNADFFTFEPAGVPIGAHVEAGQTISGPIMRPVLAFDRRNSPFIGALTITATLTGPHGALSATRWNRQQRNAAFIVDAAWGQALDTFSRARARMLVPIAPQHSAAASPMPRYHVVAISPTHGARALGDTLLLSGSNTSTLHDGDTVTLQRNWSPMTPHNAVGGFPLLLRDSAIVASVDSDGSESFRGVNPRTVAGIAQQGHRLLLVVIDGRRAGYSVGTTIRETAEWMRAMGAQQAVNLDGGGSTAMVVRDRATGTARIVNRPSDALGERPVGNALAILASQCGSR